MKNTLKEPSTVIYNIENLDCANCAAKIEKKINDLPDIKNASISFASRRLSVTAENPKELLPKIQEICDSIEDGVTITEKSGDREHEHESDPKRNILIISAAAAVFIFTLIWHGAEGGEYTLPMIAALFAAYIILGGRVVVTAVKNLFKGHIFDENFLMAAATLGAFAIAEYPEAVGVMLFFRIGEMFEEAAVRKSRSRIMEAVDLRPETVNLVTAEGFKVIGAEEAKPGDVLLVRAGERIPLDSVVIEGESRIDTSPVTGEPVPVSAVPGTSVLSGCVNTSGTLKIRAEKALGESMVTKILDSVENAAASKPKIDNFITRFARIYTPVVVLTALFTGAVIPIITRQDFYPLIYTALSFLVMSCPCALVLSVPLAFFCGIGAGSKKGILFKGGIVLEALAAVKVVIMDKTGTVTEGSFRVLSVEASDGFDEAEILSLCAGCEAASTHPIAVSIMTEAESKGIVVQMPERSEEISGMGIKAETKSGSLVCGNRKLMAETGIDISSLSENTDGTEVILAVNGVCAGRIIIGDNIKTDAAAAVESLKKQGIHCAMLTGDSEGSAADAAEKAGIDEVYSRLLPEEKLTRLKKLRTDYGAAMFVGDGINDAPVLAGADVGAAMGSGADAAIEAADVVFMNSNMSAVPQAIEISRKTAAISQQNVFFALAVKLAVLFLGLTGIYSNMWLAVFADTGVAFLCILNSIRLLYSKK